MLSIFSDFKVLPLRFALLDELGKNEKLNFGEVDVSKVGINSDGWRLEMVNTQYK